MPEPIWCFVTRAFTVRVDALPEDRPRSQLG